MLKKICNKVLLKNVLCIIICTALIFGAADDIYAEETAQTNSKIEESQTAIKEANETKNKLQSGITDAQAIIDSLKNSKEDVGNYISKLDAGMNDIQENLENLDNEISANRIKISETQAALDKAEKIRDQQYADMQIHIKYMYRSQNETFMDVLLSSSDIGDLLNKSTYIEAISDYDDDKFAEYADTVKKVNEAKTELGEEQKKLEKAKADKEEESASMQTLIAAKQEEMNSYASSIGSKEAQVEEYKSMIAEQDAQIAALEAAIAAEKKRLEEENKQARTYDGGMFTFPCPSYTRISDDYGMRMHPTLGVEMMHNGIDLAAPAGSSILAAYDGTVAAASYSSTMGNYIMIDHGDGLVTIYMHASSLLVSAGQDVSAGQEIAKVGSTGRSTGSHLHFGVRKNGSYVSPWNYLK